jgi:hypothetical protein
MSVLKVWKSSEVLIKDRRLFDLYQGCVTWAARITVGRYTMSRRCHSRAKNRGIEGNEEKIFMEMKDAVEWMLAKDRSLDRNTLQPYESTES